ncbi:hypothetical protein BC826DRAFT_1192736 [Russula brevipes]|nr:hypothetical protein BC826DRAFT_1192736 [Russula brevipes]
MAHHTPFHWPYCPHFFLPCLAAIRQSHWHTQHPSHLPPPLLQMTEHRASSIACRRNVALGVTRTPLMPLDTSKSSTSP